MCFALFFIGCFGLFDSGSDHIVGDYHVGWIDMHRNRSIYRKDGEVVVDATVFAAGHQDQFIFAKHVPYYWDRDSVVRDSVRYYIIERSKSSELLQDKPVYGPLTKRSFDSLCQRLNISQVKFDMDYSEILDD